MFLGHSSADTLWLEGLGQREQLEEEIDEKGEEGEIY